MKNRNSTPAEGSASWLSSFASSYTPFANRRSRDRRSIFHAKQSSSSMVSPIPYSPGPSMMPEQDPREPYRKDGDAKEVRRLRRLTFSARKRQPSDAATRRPLISAPTDFRHISSGIQQPISRRPSLRQTIQPSLHQDISPVPPPPQIPQRHLDEHPIRSRHRTLIAVPHFDFDNTAKSYHAHSASQPEAEQHRPLHPNDQGSASFHVPRRQLLETPPPTVEAKEAPPSIPPKAEARARPRTAPALDALKQRVAEAMIEAEMLQRRIDEIVERQTLYSNSRPSTSHSMARTFPDSSLTGLGPMPEPMPSIPALPPIAPSFADRLKLEAQRPREVLIRSVSPGVSQPTSPDDMLSSSPAILAQDGPRLAPPLPLTMRPPLRKKKSFAHVSTRDFSIHDSSHGRNGTETGTYVLKPAVSSDWPPRQATGIGTRKLPSYDSFDSVSTWDSSGRFADDSSIATPDRFSPMEPSTTFGKHQTERYEPRVGLAV